MSDNVYEKLQEHLDGLPIGFPKTPSGVEIALLKKIFEPEEAGLAARLSPKPETVESFCQRAGIDSSKAESMLDRMAGKGQIFRMKKGGQSFYNAVPFVPGIWEYQLNKIDRELAEMMEIFFKEGLGKILIDGKTPLFRVLPVDENIPVKMEVMPYHRVKELIRSQTTIALATCICRKEKRIAGYNCTHIDDVCMIFSHMANYYVDNGLARFISVDEAIDALDRSERDGLVHSPINAQRMSGMCNCCGCCCGILRGVTQLKLPPSQVFRSDFYCVCNSEACVGCGQCVERCHVGAIRLEEDVARINREQCIGCGLCVSTCPTEALQMELIPATERPEPPISMSDLYMQLAAAKVKVHK